MTRAEWVLIGLLTAFIWQKREFIILRWQVYLQRLSLPTPVKTKPNAQKIAFCLCSLIGYFLLVVLTNFASLGTGKYLNAQDIYYLGALLPSYDIIVYNGLFSLTMVPFGIMFGAAIFTVSHYLTLLVFRAIPTENATEKNWFLFFFIFSAVVTILGVAGVSILFFGTSFTHNLKMIVSFT